jgi:hypothetical protein
MKTQKEIEQEKREQILSNVFGKINDGTVENAIKTLTDALDTTRQLGVLATDLQEGNFSKIASDTIENAKNTTLSTPVRMMGTAIWDVATGNWGKVVTDTVTNISNVVSFASQTYAEYSVLKGAKIHELLKVGLLEKLAETKPDRLDAIINVIIESPLTKSYKESLGLTDQDLKEYFNLAIGIIQGTPIEKRKELSANLAAFMSATPDERPETSAKLIDNIFDIANSNPAFQDTVQKFITQVCEHQNSGRTPPSILDQIAANIQPYKKIIQNLNNKETFEFMEQNSALTNFAKKMFNVVSGPKVTPKMRENEKNAIKVQNHQSSLELAQSTIELVKQPDTIQKLIDIMDPNALNAMLLLSEQKKYKNQVDDAYQQLPGFLKDKKEELLKEKLIKSEKEYLDLLNRCEDMSVNKKLEKDLARAPNLAAKMMLIKDSASAPGIVSLFKDLAPTIKGLAADAEGLQSLSSALTKNKDKVVELLNAAIESPRGEYLRMSGITGEKLHERMHKILTPQGVGALADFMKKPGFTTGMELAIKTKSLAFACSCIINAYKNGRKESQARKRSKSVDASPSVYDQYETRNARSNTVPTPSNTVFTGRQRSSSTPGRY